MKPKFNIQARHLFAPLITFFVFASPQSLFGTEIIVGDTIQGNLFVTDTGAFRNGIDFGTNSETSLYWSNDSSNTTLSDIFTVQGSFLWRDSVTTSPSVSFKEKMRLDPANNLTLYNNSNGAGIVINPSDGKLTISNNGANSGIFFGGNNTATLKAASNGSAIFPNSVTLEGTSGTLKIDGTAQPTSSANGALTVTGGIGVGEDSYINGVRIGKGGGEVISNTALGLAALGANTTGSGLTAIGFTVLTSNTTGSWNTGIGSQALYSNTTGVWNTAIGPEAMSGLTIGSFNTAIGVRALKSSFVPGASTGNCNAALGSNSLTANTSGSWNTALGYDSQSANTTGLSNVSIGTSALQGNTTGSSNVAIGSSAGKYHSIGTTNLTDAERSIYIGAYSRGKDNDDNKSIVIGYEAIGEGANTTVIGGPTTKKTHLIGETNADSLKVAGATVLSGAVIIEQIQGDISMGNYQ